MRMLPLAGIAGLLLLLPAAAQAADAACGLRGATIVAGNEQVAVVQQDVKGKPEQVDIVGEDKPVTVRDSIRRYWFCALRTGARAKLGPDAGQPGLWDSVVAGRYAGVKVEWDAPSGAPDRTVGVLVFDARAGEVVASEFALRPYKCFCAGIGSFALNSRGAYAFTYEPEYDLTEVWAVAGDKRTLLDRSTDGSDPGKPDALSLAMADGTHLFWRDEAAELVSTARVPGSGNNVVPRRGRGAPCGLRRAAVVERNARVAVLTRTTGERVEAWVCAMRSGAATRLGVAGRDRVDVWDWHLAGRFAAIYVSSSPVRGSQVSVRTISVYDAREEEVVATESMEVDGHCQCMGFGSVVVGSDGDYAFTTWPSDQRQRVVRVIDGRPSILMEARHGTPMAPDVQSLAADVDGSFLYWARNDGPSFARF